MVSASDGTIGGVAQTVPVETVKKHAECCLCFEPLAQDRVATLKNAQGRTCGHFLHFRCATRLHETKRCPICSCRFMSIAPFPDLSDPHAWFAAVDADNNGYLGRNEVVAALKATCANIDVVDFENSIQKLWSKWDVDGDGKITKDEIFREPDGLLAYARENLRAKASQSPRLSNLDAFFTHFDEDGSGTLDKGEVYRALVKTFDLGRDVTMARTMAETLSAVWSVFDADNNGTISKAEFSAPDGLGQTLMANLGHYNRISKPEPTVPQAEVIASTTRCRSGDLEAVVITATPALPPHWEERRTPDNQIYYANHVTRTTTWERPTV